MNLSVVRILLIRFTILTEGQECKVQQYWKENISLNVVRILILDSISGNINI